jgi:DNA-binding CsgD family transcriptional regulator
MHTQAKFRPVIMDSSFDSALNEREQEVLTLVAAGLSNKAVAEELFLSPHTVAWYVQQIFSKLHVKRRTQAVAVARARGWLDPPAAQPQAPIPLQSQPNLPLQLTSFIGREEEIQEIITLLGDVRCRLLTLVGPGGIGKTRLALEVARRLPDRYSDGIYFVTMQALTSSNRIVPTIASSLGIQLMGDRQNTLEQLIEYCREKSILLVMDNYEHLLDGVQVVSDLLSAAPNIKVLATSRESLNLREEYLYNIGGLRYPDHNQITSTKGYSAVELFCERACQVYPSFSLIDVIPDVVQICQLVDGMPLALELAASWLKSLSCEDIAAEIRRGLDILTTRLRNMPERHRSMCAVFDHSWQSLSDDERKTFQRLSVFRGGFTLEAAHAVAGADVYLLQALADKSFIRRDPTSKRYEIHELLGNLPLAHAQSWMRIAATSLICWVTIKKTCTTIDSET